MVVILYIYYYEKNTRRNEWLFCARENYVDIGMTIIHGTKERKKWEKMELIY